MDKQIFQVPGVIVRDKSLVGGSRQFIIETQENLTPESLQKLISLENKLGWFTFNIDTIEAVDLTPLIDIKVDKSKYDKAKTPSQRLRSVIYLIWDKLGQKEDFNDYYNEIMEKLINQYKQKLEDL